MATDPNDPLELARVQLARLKDASDWDEPTGRTEITINMPNPTTPKKDEKPSDPPSSDKVNTITKNVSVLAKLLPEQHRLAFMLAVVIFGSVLICLWKGWIRIGQ
jgi:hypothetical protein